MLEFSFADVINHPMMSYFLQRSVMSFTGKFAFATSPLFANKITGIGFPFGKTTFDRKSNSH